MKYIYLTASLLILAYLIILTFVYFYQRNLLYHPFENNYQNDKINFDYEEIFIEVNKEIKLKAWFINKDIKRKKTLIFFHGNAGDLTNRVHKLNKLNDLDINILLISWRGFSGNKGHPTESNLYQDAQKSINWLNNIGVKNSQIILYGESLGTGVAVELGKKNIYNSVILESPFTSIENAAKIYYPFLPVSLILKDRFDTISKIRTLKLPILIMHGKKDDIVPFFMGKELFEEANNPKHSFFTDNDDHMMEFNETLISEIRSFIKRY